MTDARLPVARKLRGTSIARWLRGGGEIFSGHEEAIVVEVTPVEHKLGVNFDLELWNIELLKARREVLEANLSVEILVHPNKQVLYLHKLLCLQ